MYVHYIHKNTDRETDRQTVEQTVEQTQTDTHTDRQAIKHYYSIIKHNFLVYDLLKKGHLTEKYFYNHCNYG